MIEEEDFMKDHGFYDAMNGGGRSGEGGEGRGGGGRGRGEGSREQRKNGALMQKLIPV